MSDMATLRTALGWSQSKMGECLGLDQSNVQRIETGAQPVSRAAQRTLDRLAFLVAEGRALPGMSVAAVVDLMIGRTPPDESQPEPCASV